MPDVSRDYGEATVQRNSPNAEIGIAQRCSPALQLCSHLAITTSSGPVKGKGRQVWQEGLVQLLQKMACTFPQSVDPVDQLPRVMLEVNCCSGGTEASLEISTVEGVRLRRLLRMSVSRRYIRL